MIHKETQREQCNSPLHGRPSLRSNVDKIQAERWLLKLPPVQEGHEAALGDERGGELRRGVGGRESQRLHPQAQAGAEGAEGITRVASVHVAVQARRNGRGAARRIEGVPVDDRQEHRHGGIPRQGRHDRSVGSMPTPREGNGRGR